MSFSSEVKEELAKQFSRSRHCQLAELAALLCFSGSISDSELKITTEHASTAKKCFSLIKHIYDTSAHIQMQHNSYVVSIDDSHEIGRILEAEKMAPEAESVNGMLLQNACCRRAYIRGAFLSAGSISNPQKSYHFEIVCTKEAQAEQLRDIICDFNMDAKIVERKRHYVVYIKEGAQIVDMLNIMEAHMALMDLENVRIIKEMRNSVNRQVNCETANINKTVNAAVRQIEDIKYIQENSGLDELSENLREIALLRLEYPDTPLKELGDLLNPPVGKSGVNHRLRKINSIAEKMREESL